MNEPDSHSTTPRHWIALTAAVAGMVALYLHLWKIGKVGSLVCTASGGCEKAQFSQYGSFLGVDVAMWGMAAYAAIFITALIGVQPRLINARRVTQVLMALIIPGFLFTLYLKYAEFVILRTFCPWCLISAVTISLQTILVIVDWRRVRSEIGPFEPTRSKK